MLDAGGLPTTGDRYFTLSFTEDGTEIAGFESRLFDKFDSAFESNEWQTTILRAFQTWSSVTATDVGVVQESGQFAFGTAGPSVADDRFGDVRIGARPLAKTAMAISVSQDSYIGGTWAADVVFNSEAEFNSLDDLYSVALHEAGHVFGLEHSSDSESPMHIHGVSVVNELTAADIQNVKRKHGSRIADEYEDVEGNGSRDHATDIETVESLEDVTGSGPAVALGNLSTRGDVDFYRIEPFDDYRGPVTFRLLTSGISLLAPRFTVYENDDVIGQFETLTPLNEEMRLTVSEVDHDAEYFVRIESTAREPFSVGSYSLIVTFDDAVRVDEGTIDEFARTRLRQLDSDIVDALLSVDRSPLDDDMGSNDDVDDAVELEGSIEFEDATRYQVLGSISTREDIDNYRFSTPDVEGLMASISVRSLDPGELIPNLAIMNEDGLPQQSKTLINGGGEVLLQTAVEPDKEQFIQVSGAGSQFFETGDYELTISFSSNAAEILPYVNGTVSDTQDLRSVHIATPQLVHLALSVDDRVPKANLLFRLLNEAGDSVHQIAARSGETRTAGSVLLSPGSYTSQVFVIGSLDANVADIHYEISGSAISDPFAVDPEEPSDAEFLCPDIEDMFCYPGEIISDDPFIWVDFIDSLPEVPSLTNEELQSALLGDWWSWYWQSVSENAPPLPAVDEYQVDAGNTLVVPASQGVLQNDFDPDSSQVSAAVEAAPQHGELEFSPDGSFSYTPQKGFAGLDSFTYKAFDFLSSSQASSVTINVRRTDNIAGDFDHNGVVDEADINALAVAIRSNGGNDFDVNGDNRLDSGDWSFMITTIVGTTFGDANLDGNFDSSDLVEVFEAGLYEDDIHENATWATGDWNGDGEFGTGDLITAFQAGRYELAAAITSIDTDGNGVRARRQSRTLVL